MSTMAMAPPCDGDGDWRHLMGLGDFNMFLCSSSSPLTMATGTRAEDCLPFAAAPPGPGGADYLQIRCKNEVLEEEASSDAAFAAADCLSSALMNLQREDESFYLPMYSAPPPALVVGDQYCSDDRLPPLPADGALASLDEALLLPFSDIDLEAFDNNADDDHKPPPVDQMILIPPPAVHHHPHHPAAAGTRAPPIHGTTVVGQNASVVIHAAHQKKAMAGIEDDSCLRRGGASGVEMAAVIRHDDERRRHAGSAMALMSPAPPHPLLPPSLPLPQPRARRTGGLGHRSSALAGKTTRLDHIGFDELRKYFYMPITRAAREMNVGLTVLKKRCRELGVARWPHRKMKSLRSLMANVQEMGNVGMSPVAMQQELAALETYCALMEENPWIELTERTKKLRQACFKESYKRRRAAAVSVMEMDHDIYSFGQQQHGHHHQLPPPPTSSDDADDRHGHQQQSSCFFDY